MGQFWTATKFNVILKFSFCMNYLASLTTFFYSKLFHILFLRQAQKWWGNFGQQFGFSSYKKWANIWKSNSYPIYIVLKCNPTWYHYDADISIVFKILAMFINCPTRLIIAPVQNNPPPRYTILSAFTEFVF